MGQIRMVPCEEPLCLPHFWDYILQLAEGGAIDTRQPDTPADPSTMAFKKKQKWPVMATRTQPGRRVKKPWRPVISRRGRSINRRVKCKIEITMPGTIAPPNTPHSMDITDSVSTPSFSQGSDLTLSDDTSPGSRAGVKTGHDIEPPFFQPCETDASVNGSETWPYLRDEILWAIRRELALRTELTYCPFGIKRWECKLCKEAEQEADLGSGPWLLEEEDYMEGPCAGYETAIDMLPQLRADWYGMEVPAEKKILVGDMEFVMDTCEEPMVLML